MLTVERNTGYESGRLAAKFLSNWPNTYCIKEKTSSFDYGWWTSHTSKNEYSQQLWIKMAEGAIYYMDGLICINPWMDALSRKERTVKEFEEQCSRFQAVQKPNKNPFQAPSMTTSGKVDHEGKLQEGVDDDMAMNLAMNLCVTMKIQTRSIPGVDYAKLLGDRPNGDAHSYRGIKRTREPSEPAREAQDKRQRKLASQER